MTIKHVLVPTDLSDSASLSIRFGVLFASHFGARLTGLHADAAVYSTSVVGDGPAVYIASPPDVGMTLESRLRAHLDAYASGFPCDAKVVIGSPVAAIVNAADDLGADLIVMGTHGRHGWRRALLGSVAESVVHRAKQLVLTVAARTAEHWPGRVAVTRIVCPINFSEVARQSLRTAVEIAQSFGAELLVVHVREPGAEPDDSSLDAQFRHWILPEVAGRVEYRELVVRGGAAERVLDCVEDLDADFLVLGARRSTFADKTVIGATTERLIGLASCPVLTVAHTATAVSEEPEYAGSVAL